MANKILRDVCKVAEKIKLKPCNEYIGVGVLRYDYIRINGCSKKALLIIVIRCGDFPGSRNFLKELLNLNSDIETVVLNYNNKKTSMIPGNRDRVLYGKGSIIDEIDGLKFRISNKSFYQVNPVQTEILYRTAIKLADISKNDIVLDACFASRVIIMTEANRSVKSRVLKIVPKIKTEETDSLYVA